MLGRFQRTGKEVRIEIDSYVIGVDRSKVPNKSSSFRSLSSVDVDDEAILKPSE